MATPNTPIVNGGLPYVSGLFLSNDATTPNTQLDMSLGLARDSTNTNDINLAAPIVINGVLFGVANGVDVAALVASTFYAVYVIGDSNDFKPTAGLLSLNAVTPTLPVGYDMFRRVGYILTDSSAHILKFWQYAHNIARTMWYDTPIATPAITTSTTYVSESLAAGVPSMATTAILRVLYTANSATNVAQFAPFGSTASVAMTVFGYGVAAAQAGMLEVPVALNVLAPTITHKETSASDALVLTIAGYVDNL